MKKLVLLLALSSPAWGAYSYKRAITIDHTKVPNSDLTNFPVLISVTDATLKNTAAGGKVSDIRGNDIGFYSDSAGTTKLTWDIDTYDPLTGNLIGWATVPTLSHTVDTVIYLFYGDVSISSFQGGDAWATSYKWVQHLRNGVALKDSSATGNNGTNVSSAALTSGKIGGGISLTAATGFTASDAGQPTGTSAHGVSYWVRTNTTVDTILMAYGGGAGNFSAVYSGLFNLGGGHHAAIVGTGGSGSNCGANTDLNDSAWHLIHGVVSNTASQAKVYVDGALVATCSITSNTVLGGAANVTGTSGWTIDMDEIRIYSGDPGEDWTAAEYNNQNSPSTFLTLGSEVASGLATISTALYFPTNVSGNVLNLFGTGTSWTGGTTFTVSGVSGVSKTAQSVVSGTVATITLTTGNVTGLLSISDGTTTTAINIISPGMTATYSSPWLYVTQTGVNANGDTWVLMQTVNGIRSILNDGTGIDGEISGGSNIAFYSESNDLTSLTLINKLTGLGTSSQASLGICSINAGSMKSNTVTSFDGLYLMSVFCNQGPTSNFTSFQVSSSTDDGAHWWRVQDATAISSCTWSAGTATCTTPTQTTPLTSGNLVIVQGVLPSGYNGTFTATSGTNSTTVKYAVSNPGTYVSGGVVLGPGSANGVPHTTALFPTNDNIFRVWLVTYNTDNTACCGNIDGNNTYLTGLIYFGGALLHVRIPKASWWDSSTWIYWVEGTTFTSDKGSATPVQCLAGSTYVNCAAASFTFIISLTYLTDSNLPDGGQYVAMGAVGQDSIWTASHLYGPWQLTSSAPMDDAVPVSFGFSNTLPMLYSSTGAKSSRFRFQTDGQYFTNYYFPIHRDVEFTWREPNASPLFNGNSGPGYGHITNGLAAFWNFQTYGDYFSSPVPDLSGNGRSINLANANVFPKYQMASTQGMENANPARNIEWQSNGGAWDTPTGYAVNHTDFTISVVFKTDGASLPQTIVGWDTNSNGFSIQVTSGPQLTFKVRNGATISFDCPAPAAGSFQNYILIRKSGVPYCFKSNVWAPTTQAVTDATALGTYNLQLAGMPGNSAYFRGTIGEVAIWSRALCSTDGTAALACAAGLVGEVQREFLAAYSESRNRGWGLPSPASPTAAGGSSLGWTTLTNGQWTGLSNGQWAALGN